MSAPITLTGRLGSDPELRFSASGKAVVNMRVVTDRRIKEADEWKSVDTTWWQVTAFGKLAERIVERLSKGDPIVVIGRAKGREWEDIKSGEKRTALDIIADSVSLDLARVRDDTPRPTALPQANDPWAQSDDAPF